MAYFNVKLFNSNGTYKKEEIAKDFDKFPRSLYVVNEQGILKKYLPIVFLLRIQVYTGMPTTAGVYNEKTRVINQREVHWFSPELTEWSNQTLSRRLTEKGMRIVGRTIYNRMNERLENRYAKI